ncbi:MAG TPA: zinc-ribbon domain-containing protein [Polyangiales bacterium]|nr:zinc-ribbon domain-containing protein [Polyangiales bacterium]
MKISCPACAAKYSIADEKVQDRLAKIRCRKCGATIVIDGKVTPPNVYAADGSAADHPNVAVTAPVEVSREYSVDFGDNDQRTLTLADIVSAYNAGEISADTFLWADGMSDWKALGEIPEVVDALHAAASAPESTSPSPVSVASSPRSAATQAAPVPAVAAAPSPAASPWDPRPPVEPQQSDAALARAAARKGGGNRAPTADLFGSFDPRADEAVATSVREPDLGAAGARNESSVLFSLSALTQSAAKPGPAAPVAAKPVVAAPATNSGNTREDSGLIDLRALTAAAPQQAQPAHEPLMNSPLGVSPLGMSPLGLAAPFGGGVEAHVSPLDPGTKSNKTGLFVGVGIVVAALVIAVAFILRPSEPPPAPAPTTPAQAQQAPAPTADEPAQVTAKPPATGTSEDNAAPDAGGATAKPRAVPRGTPRGTPRRNEETKSGSSTAAPEKKPAVKRSPCGCAPGDLQCAMRCAAGK